jgi:endonuclease III
LRLAAFLGWADKKNPEKVRHWIYEIVKNFKIEEVRNAKTAKPAYHKRF